MILRFLLLLSVNLDVHLQKKRVIIEEISHYRCKYVNKIQAVPKNPLKVIGTEIHET